MCVFTLLNIFKATAFCNPPPQIWWSVSFRINIDSSFSSAVIMSVSMALFARQCGDLYEARGSVFKPLGGHVLISATKLYPTSCFNYVPHELLLCVSAAWSKYACGRWVHRRVGGAGVWCKCLMRILVLEIPLRCNGRLWLVQVAHGSTAEGGEARVSSSSITWKMLRAHCII